jgi:hypothetical protein
MSTKEITPVYEVLGNSATPLPTHIQEEIKRMGP